MTDRMVKVSLVIDDHGSVRVMRKAGEESSRTEHKMQQLDKGVQKLGHSFGGLKSMIGAGLGALGVGGTLYGIKDVVSGMQEAAAATEQFSATSGIGAQQSLLISQALKARGINAEAGGKAFGFMTKNLQTAERQWHSYGSAQKKASETGKTATGLLGVQATAFKELGLSVSQLAGESGEQKLESVVKAFENMPAPMRKAGDAGRLMKQIFGKSGEGLATVLQGGALGLTNMTNAAREFFPTLKTGSLEEMRVQTARSNLAFEGLKFTLGQDLVPILIEVDQWFVKSIKEIEKGQGTWGALRHDVEGVVSAMKGVVGWLDRLGKAFNIPVGQGGLGAALMAFAGIQTIKHPGKTAGKAATIVKKTGHYLVEHPYAIPAAAAVGAGAAIPFGSAAGIRAGAEAISPGYLKEHSLAEMERVLTGRVPVNSGGGGAHAELNGKAAPVHVHVNLNGKQFAEAIVRDYQASRVLAESAAHYTSKMAARGVAK